VGDGFHEGLSFRSGGGASEGVLGLVRSSRSKRREGDLPLGSCSQSFFGPPSCCWLAVDGDSQGCGLFGDRVVILFENGQHLIHIYLVVVRA